jgi:TolB protein
MDLDGQNPHKLTLSKEGNFTPTWSPDGIRILYESVPLNGALSGNRELWVMDGEGKNTRKLADGFNPEERDLFFITDHFHSTALEATRSEVAKGLTVSKPYEVFTCGLSWSPDGRKIAFESVRGSSISIWTINSDGTNPVQLTRDLSNNWHPTWSPDGKHIAFASDRSGNYDIWMIDAAGGTPVPLTHDLASDFRPSWSPDGKKIVFTSLRSGTADLWIVKIPS